LNAIMAEELSHAHAGSSGDGILLHNDTCLPYLLAAASDEQKARWLPGVCSGELILAIAMTEPGTTTTPPPRSVIDGRHASVMLTMPRTFTSKRARTCASVNEENPQQDRKVKTSAR
jgi:Acyl-CoA dehydrogenase, N-terminal domain